VERRIVALRQARKLGPARLAGIVGVMLTRLLGHLITRVTV
jgi:hypothetical protein